MLHHKLHESPTELEQQFRLAAGQTEPFAIGQDGTTVDFRVRDRNTWPYAAAITDAAGNLVAGAEGASSQVVVSGLPNSLRPAVRLILGEMTHIDEGVS
ncbi:MAG TPA: hypothetical protein VMB52_05275 [Verrucomicrobiae bacterium]|nr:hypothetical protein [Verrucomicrobiae bacterium]